MTPRRIREGFQNLRDGEEMAGLADAARSRSESDWLIGINGTRALTKRMFGSRAGNVASVGRVQTPTLAIVYARELEIRNFKPRDYWRVTAKFEIAQGDYEGVYQRPDFKKRRTTSTTASTASGTRTVAEAVVAACQGQPLATVSEEKKASTQIAPRLYDLTTLQREANDRYGFSAKRTLQIAQALYERHKMITYPRTDSRALPEDYLPVVRQTLGNLPGVAAIARPEGARERLGAAQQAHLQQRANLRSLRHHSRPASEAKNLDEVEAKIYDMIARRFVAAFYPGGGIRCHDAAQPGRRAQVQDRGQSPDLRRLARSLWQEHSRRRFAQGKALPALIAEDKNQAKTLEAESARRSDQTAAALHRSDAALRDGNGGQTGRRRGVGRSDEGARPRHAGDARRHDRRAHLPKVHAIASSASWCRPPKPSSSSNFFPP